MKKFWKRHYLLSSLFLTVGCWGVKLWDFGRYLETCLTFNWCYMTKVEISWTDVRHQSYTHTVPNYIRCIVKSEGKWRKTQKNAFLLSVSYWMVLDLLQKAPFLSRVCCACWPTMSIETTDKTKPRTELKSSWNHFSKVMICISILI